MRYLISTILLTTIGFMSMAQNDKLTPKDPKAKKILDELSVKTKAYSSISINFDFTLKNKKEGLNDTQSGEIILKGDKYIVDVGEQKIYSDGNIVWTYLEDAKEVQISEVDEDDETSVLNPKSILTLYEKGFKYVMDKEKTIDNIALHVIKMYPLNPSEKPYHTVILSIDKVKNQIYSIEIKSKDGNTFIYTIKDFLGNKAYPDSDFTFVTPKGVEEIDLR